MYLSCYKFGFKIFRLLLFNEKKKKKTQENLILEEIKQLSFTKLRFTSRKMLIDMKHSMIVELIKTLK